MSTKDNNEKRQAVPEESRSTNNRQQKIKINAKALYAVFIILVLYFSSYLLPAERQVKRSAFFVLFFSFFTVNSLIQLQAEMTSAALCFLCASLILCGKKPALILSGFTGALLFFFKSIFILLYISAVFCAFIYNFYFGRCANAKRYLISAASMLIFETVFLTAVFLIYPQEFKDMSYASNFQSTLLSEGLDVSLNLIAD